jgi:hypothetical protein
LGKLDAPLPVHLLYEFEQTAMVGSVTSNDIGCTAEEVVTILDSPNERVELLAAVARGHHDGLSPRFADGVEELLYQYVQQVVCTLRWAVVDALAQRRGAGGQFFNTKVFHYQVRVIGYMNLIRDKFVVNSWQFVFSFRHKLSQIAHEFSINYYCVNSRAITR